MDSWEQFALAYVASNDIQYDRERSQRKLRESFANHMNKVQSEFREVSQSGMIQHPYIPYVPGAELNIKLTNNTLHSVPYGLYDKIRGVDMPGVFATKPSPKLTAKEEDLLDSAFDVLNAWTEFDRENVVRDGEDFVVTGCYYEDYAKIMEAAGKAYEVVGALSAKKYSREKGWLRSC